MAEDREGWRDALAADVDALPIRRRDRRGAVTDHEVDFLQGAYSAVVRAAAGRRMSIPAYVRRATYALAALDLGIDVHDLLERDPRCARDTGLRIDDPAGVKFGSWEVAHAAQRPGNE